MKRNRFFLENIMVVLSMLVALMVLASCSTDIVADQNVGTQDFKLLGYPVAGWVRHLKELLATILILSCSVVYLAVYIFRWYYVSKRKRNVELERQNIRFLQLRNVYDKARTEYDELQNDYEAYVKKKGEELEALRTQMTEYVGQEQNVDIWDEARTMFNDEAVTRLHEMLERGKMPGNKELKECVKLVETRLPTFWSVVSDPTKKLTLQEIQVCALLRACFIPSEIATIMNVSLQRTTNMKTKINQKLFGVKSAKGLEDRLMTLK